MALVGLSKISSGRTTVIFQQITTRNRLYTIQGIRRCGGAKTISNPDPGIKDGPDPGGKDDPNPR